MRKILMYKFTKFISVVLFSSIYFFPFNYNNNYNNIVSSLKFNTNNISDIAIKVMEEANKQEEVVSDNNVSNITNYVSYNENNNVNNSVSYNSISISNVLNKNLMKDENGDHFYLSHNINGVYDGVGVPYIDFRNDFNTRKTIIYAHSSTSGNGPFQVLQNYYYNKGFYDNNRYITINYNGNTYTYEIFSVYVSVADNESSEGLEYFHRMNYSDSEWEEAINKYKANSIYDTGVSVNGNDKIVILQTCSMDPNYYNKYYRYNLLIMGKLI